MYARPTEWGSVCGGRPGQGVEEQGTHGNTARQVVDGLRTEVWGQQKHQKQPKRTCNNQSNNPLQQPAQPQYTNC